MGLENMDSFRWQCNYTSALNTHKSTKTKYKQTDSTMFDEIVFLSVFMSFNFNFNNLQLMHKSKEKKK